MQVRLSFTESLNRQASPGFKPRDVDHVVDSVTFSEALDLARPETDRVLSPARVNPASDALLLNLVDKLPRSLAGMTWAAIGRWVTHGDTTPEALRQPFEPGKDAPFELGDLLGKLEAEMVDHPPFIGPEHVWSEESKPFGYWKRLGKAVLGERPLPFPTFGASKLLCALGLGATAVVMPTGREDDLKAWILSQDTVEVHQVFGHSYRLHEGDLYATLLCAENVLSEGLYTPDRQERELTSHLAYLRNDSAPVGDNFGAWYHLFGSALYSLVRPEWKARLSMQIENAGSLILEGDDPQEEHINRLGVELGQALRRRTEGNPGAVEELSAWCASSSWKTSTC